MRTPALRHVHGHHCNPAATSGLETERVAALARKQFRLSAWAMVRAEELATVEPGFPPIETRLTFWTDNENEHRYRIFKPMTEVMSSDLPPGWYRDALIVDPYPFCDCCG